MNQPAIESQTEEIKTAHTITQVHHQPGCRVKLEIKVDPHATQAAHVKALKAVGKEISIPGFRKGKVPDNMILKQFGTHVTRQWHELLVNTAFEEFLAKTHLYPFTRDKSMKRVEVKSASLEEGTDLLIEYETGPLVPKIDKQQIKISPMHKQSITEKDIDDRLHTLQLHYADWALVTDRPVQEGDFVDLDIVAIDTHPPRPICQEMRFEVAQDKMGDWMRQLISGHPAGESVEGISQLDEKAAIDTPFTPTHCRITIRAIYTTQPPAVDEAFAKKLGVENLADLRPRIENELNRQAEAEAQDQRRAQVEEQLLAQYQFDLPSSMIAEQKRQLVAERLQRLKQTGAEPEAFEQLKQEVEAEVVQELNRAYRLFFLCKSVADEHKIDVNQSEVIEEMSRQIMLAPHQAYIFSKPDEEMRSKLYVNVLSRKALDFLAS